MIYHAYSAYLPKNPDTARRHKLAEQTWKTQPWKEIPVRDDELPRLWREEGRTFPYVRDVFDRAVLNKAGEDIVVYTNADILVRSDCCVQIACALQAAAAVYCFRRDFHRLDAPLGDNQYSSGVAYAGHDLTAFRVSWWQAHRGQMPDMIIGHEAWDPCLRVLVDRTNPGCDTVLRDVIAHERHGSYWENSQNRYRLRGQKYNLALAKDFLKTNGIDPRRHGIPERL